MNQNHQQKAAYSKPAFTRPATTAAAPARVPGNSVKITGLFKSEKGKGYEVRVTDEMVARFSEIKAGSYLKVYENTSEKTGTQYLSLSVKNLG